MRNWLAVESRGLALQRGDQGDNHRKTHASHLVNGPKD